MGLSNPETDPGLELQALHQQAAIGLFRTHVASGRMISCNLRAAQILGHASADECRRMHNAAASYADPLERERLLKLLSEQGEVRAFAVRILRPDGSVAPVRLWAKLHADLGIVDAALDDAPA